MGVKRDDFASRRSDHFAAVDLILLRFNVDFTLKTRFLLTGVFGVTSVNAEKECRYVTEATEKTEVALNCVANLSAAFFGVLRVTIPETVSAKGTSGVAETIVAATPLAPLHLPSELME